MKKLFLLLLLILTSQSWAQLQAIKGKTSYNFWLQLPEKEVLINKPAVIIFLHGKSLSGTDLKKVKRYGVLRAVEKGRKIPAIIVAPQLPSGPWNPEKVAKILDYVQKKYDTDKNRVYVMGMSLGSYGTMDVVGTMPDRIAGAVSICGGGTVKLASNIAKVPVWVLHGNADRAVPMSESKKIVDAVKKANPKAPIKLTIIKGGTHGSVENLFHKDETYAWLFKQNKNNPDLEAEKVFGPETELADEFVDITEEINAPKVELKEVEKTPNTEEKEINAEFKFVE